MARCVRAETREGMSVTTVTLRDDMHRRLAMAIIEESTVMAENARRALGDPLDRRGRKAKRPRRP